MSNNSNTISAGTGSSRCSNSNSNSIIINEFFDNENRKQKKTHINFIDNKKSKDNTNSARNENAIPEKRRNLGRAARTRRRKILEIQKQADEQFLLLQQQQKQRQNGRKNNQSVEKDEVKNCNDDSKNKRNGNDSSGETATMVPAQKTTTCLPTDRNRVWAGVLERRRSFSSKNTFDSWTIAELVSQLGYVPGNLLRVVAYTSMLPKLDLYYKNSNNNSDKDDESDSITRCRSPPVVIELYPIVLRDAYQGGKTQGRKKKARKRCISNISHTNSDNKKSSSNDNTATETTNTLSSVSNNNLHAKKNVNATGSYSSSTAVATANSSNNVSTTTSTQIKRTNSTNIEDENTNYSNGFENIAGDIVDDDKTVVEPFPTIYWLTHPLIRILVSKLELQNCTSKYEQRLSDDPDALRSMIRAHKAYALRRYDLLTTADKKMNISNNRQQKKKKQETLPVCTLPQSNHSLVSASGANAAAETTVPATSMAAVPAVTTNAAATPVDKRKTSNNQATESIESALKMDMKADTDSNALVSCDYNDKDNNDVIGIAGIRNFSKVKCLHAHLAHYLSSTNSPFYNNNSNGGSDNIVGRWVFEAVTEMLL